MDSGAIVCEVTTSTVPADSLLACSRLRDSGEKSFSKKKCEKRAGAGERQGGSLPFFSPPPRPFPSRVRLIFALLVLKYVRTILSESLAQANSLPVPPKFTAAGEKSMRDEQTPLDVCGEAKP